MHITMKNIKTPISLISLILLLSACGNLSREVDLDLPEYERELSVESYLLPGVPLYFVSLKETVGYFDEFELPVIDDATVIIKYGTEVDTLIPVNLAEGFTLPGISTDTIRLFLPGVQHVYLGLRLSPDDLNKTFELSIDDEKRDRKASATTRLIEPVNHDSLTYMFDNNGRALVLTHFTDIPNQKNYYRRILKVKRPFRISGTTDSVWLSDVEQAFVFDDELQDGQPFTLGTGFEYETGDTLISFLYHIEKAYFDYIQSADGATQANFNPFAQPTRILDNINGGTGIFTGMALDVDTVIIGQ